MNITQKAKILLKGVDFTTRWDNGPLYRAYVSYFPGVGFACVEVLFEEDENNASLVLEQKALDTVENMIYDKSVNSPVTSLMNIFDQMLVADFDNDLETLDDFIYDVMRHG